VLERTLGTNETDEAGLRELEELLDSRIRRAQAGAVSQRASKAVFAEATRERAK
jgi:hypothetical protein